MTTDRERMEHLLNGGKLVRDTSIKYLDAKGTLVCQFHTFQASPTTLVGDEKILPINPEWYETIIEDHPETRVLCMAYAEDKKTEILDFIIRYDSNDKELPFEGTISWYSKARPATLEEVKKYIYASS